MFSSTDYTKPIKVILLGDGSTGKSSFYERLCNYNDPEYRFNKRYRATTDFNLKKIKLSTDKGPITLFIWDTAGQEKYGGDLRDGYIQGADAAIIMYDVTNRDTISNVQKWLDNINEVCNSGSSIPVAVVGNKIDKIKKVDSLDHVKLRDVRLKSMYKKSNITNHLVSVKENTWLQEGGFMSSEKVVDEGILNPIEFLLSNIFSTSVKVTRQNVSQASASDNF